MNQHDCQHICHRVVTTAFQFQHGAQIMLQVHFCERRMANTEAESVDDMVDASKREVINGRWMLVQLMPDSHQINNPVKRAVSSTPAVDKTMPGVNMGFISVNLVSMPSGEQNDAECNHADELCFLGVVELQSQSVTAEQHTDDKEKQ